MATPATDSLPVGEPVAAGVAVVSPTKPQPAGADAALPAVAPIRSSGPDASAAEAPDADEAAVPAEAVPIQASPVGAAAVEVTFEGNAPADQLLPAIEAVTELLRSRPGSLPVLLEVPVAGARHQIRLRERVAWDERLADALREATDLPVAVALRPGSAES